MKILLVEDDLEIAELTRRGLTAEGFTVEVVHNGVDGSWRATEGSYDLVILDVLLPGRNGYLVCADIRASGSWVPILMLTAKGGDLDEAEGLDTGADDYLVKPYSFTVLVARIRALLRRASDRRPLQVEVGDIRIDPAARRVWRSSVEVELTSREFDVLKYLIRRAGEVVPKTKLLAGVWSDDFDGDPNIVEVYIRRLRLKLGDRDTAGPIVTIRGAGYRLEVP